MTLCLCRALAVQSVMHKHIYSHSWWSYSGCLVLCPLSPHDGKCRVEMIDVGITSTLPLADAIIQRGLQNQDTSSAQCRTLPPQSCTSQRKLIICLHFTQKCSVTYCNPVYFLWCNLRLFPALKLLFQKVSDFQCRPIKRCGVWLPTPPLSLP